MHVFKNISLALIMICLGVFMYLLIKRMGGQGTGSMTTGCIAYVVTYLFLLSGGSDIYNILAEDFPTMVAILSLAFIICLVRMVIGIGSLFKGSTSWAGSGGDGKGGFFSNLLGGGKTPEQKEEDRLKQEEQNAENLAKRIEKDGKKIEEIGTELDNDINRMTTKTIDTLKRILKAMTNLDVYITFIEKHREKDHEKAKEVYDNQYHKTLHQIANWLNQAVPILTAELHELNILTSEKSTIVSDFWADIHKKYMIKNKTKTDMHIHQAFKEMIKEIQASKNSTEEKRRAEHEVGELKLRYEELLNRGKATLASIPENDKKTHGELLMRMESRLKETIRQFRNFHIFFQNYDESGGATPGTFKMQLINYAELKKIIAEMKKIIKTYEGIAPFQAVPAIGYPPPAINNEQKIFDNLKVLIRLNVEFVNLLKKVQTLHDDIINKFKT